MIVGMDTYVAFDSLARSEDIKNQERQESEKINHALDELSEIPDYA